MKKLSEELGKVELGQGGSNTKDGTIRADEFLPDLKGKRAIRKFREMRDNDSTIGAVMYATEQVLRDVDYYVEPANDSDEAKKEADFVKSVLEDMEHTLDDHISEALSHLTFGFSIFEVVYSGDAVQTSEQVRNTLNIPMAASEYANSRLAHNGRLSDLMWTRQQEMSWVSAKSRTTELRAFSSHLTRYYTTRRRTRITTHLDALSYGMHTLLTSILRIYR